jgi:ADP-ribose pyrophosphatase
MTMTTTSTSPPPPPPGWHRGWTRGWTPARLATAVFSAAFGLALLWHGFRAGVLRGASRQPRGARVYSRGYTLHRTGGDGGAEVFAASAALAAEATTPYVKPPGHCAPLWSKTSAELSTVSRKILFENEFARFAVHQVRTRDGSMRDWVWFEEPDQINCIVSPSPGRVVLFKQSKYGLHGESLAPVGGGIEDGESPLETAKREVREEMHMTCSRWTFLGRYRVATNRGGGFMSSFLAEACDKLDDRLDNAFDLETMELTTLNFAELRAAFKASKFKEIKWAATIGLALPVLEQGTP